MHLIVTTRYFRTFHILQYTSEYFKVLQNDSYNSRYLTYFKILHILQNISRYSKMIVLQCTSGCFTYFKILWNILKSFRIFQRMPGHFKIFHNRSVYFRIFYIRQYISRYFRIFYDISAPV